MKNRGQKWNLRLCSKKKLVLVRVLLGKDRVKTPTRAVSKNRKIRQRADLQSLYRRWRLRVMDPLLNHLLRHYDEYCM